jgi:hypothetical protein
MEDPEAILAYLTAVQDGIFDNAKSVNQKIPVNSFRKEVSGNGGTLYAAEYMQWLFKGTGSAPGKMRPVEPFYKFIVKEGIQPYPRENKDGSFSAVSQESLAWAMAISQAREGSQIYQGKKPGVDLQSVMEKETPIFLTALAKNKAATIATAMRTALMIALVFLCSCSNKFQVKRDTKRIENKKIKTEMRPFYWGTVLFSTLVFVNVMTQPE